MGLCLLGVELPPRVQAWLQLESLQVSWGFGLPRGGEGLAGSARWAVRTGCFLGVWLCPLGVCPGCPAVSGGYPFSPLSLLSLPPLLPTPSMLLPSFFLSEPLMLWGSPQVGGVFFI